MIKHSVWVDVLPHIGRHALFQPRGHPLELRQQDRLLPPRIARKCGKADQKYQQRHQQYTAGKTKHRAKQTICAG
jgi:hypothetical protein